MDRLTSLLETHPEPAGSDRDVAVDCIAAAAECALVCTACADACLGEDNPSHLRDCIRLDQDCADLCGIVARMLARAGRQDRETLERTLEACIRACRACATECDRHATKMEHCRVCAETCRACADACESMVGALVG
jgi:hypothetical protein